MNSSSGETQSQDYKEPANLRFLRILVTVLTATMILGVITIVGLLVMRLNAPVAGAFSADDLAIPDGVTVTAVTRTDTEILVVTAERELLIFDASGAEIRKSIPLE